MDYYTDRLICTKIAEDCISLLMGVCVGGVLFLNRFSNFCLIGSLLSKMLKSTFPQSFAQLQFSHLVLGFF